MKGILTRLRGFAARTFTDMKLSGWGRAGREEAHGRYPFDLPFRHICGIQLPMIHRIAFNRGMRVITGSSVLILCICILSNALKTIENLTEIAVPPCKFKWT